MLFDPVYSHKDVPGFLSGGGRGGAFAPPRLTPDVPTVSVIKATVAAFKESQNAPRQTAAD